MKNGSGDEDEERFRRRGRRTVPETMMEDGNVYVVLEGAPRKILYHNDLTLFRVGIFTTLKMAEPLLFREVRDACTVSS